MEPGVGLFDDAGQFWRDLIPAQQNLDVGSASRPWNNFFVNTLNVGDLEFSAGDAGLEFFNTADETTNYERTLVKYAADIFEILSQKGGTGTARPIRIGVESASTNIYLDLKRSAAPFFSVSGDATYAGAGPFITFGDGTSASLGSAAASGVAAFFKVAPYINQSGTAGYIALLVNAVENAVGSGSKLLADFQVGGTTKFNIDDTGLATVQGGLTFGASAASIIFGAAAQTIKFKTGANGKVGSVALSGGTATVSNTAITANSKVFFFVTSLTNAGFLAVTTITAGVSFVITSSNGSDARTVQYVIVETD